MRLFETGVGGGNDVTGVGVGGQEEIVGGALVLRRGGRGRGGYDGNWAKNSFLHLHNGSSRSDFNAHASRYPTSLNFVM